MFNATCTVGGHLDPASGLCSSASPEWTYVAPNLETRHQCTDTFNTVLQSCTSASSCHQTRPRCNPGAFYEPDGFVKVSETSLTDVSRGDYNTATFDLMGVYTGSSSHLEVMLLPGQYLGVKNNGMHFT